MSKLVLSRQRDETIVVILEDGRIIDIDVVDIRGDKVRLMVHADKSIKVHRKEIWETIRREAAAKNASQSKTVADKAVDPNQPPLDKEKQ